MKNLPPLIYSLLVAFLVLTILAIDLAAAGTAPPRDSAAPVPAAALSSQNTLYLPLVLRIYNPSARLWRFGVGKVHGSLLDNESPSVAQLRFGWYTDFQATANAPEQYGLEYVPMVRLKQWKLVPNSSPPQWTTWCRDCPYVQPYTYTVLSPGWDQIQAMPSAHRGRVWLIGNEIERRDWDTGYQDEILPEVYVRAYHDLYAAIKNADPTAQVAMGGMIQATPLRLEYLERIWNGYYQTYGQIMPVDIWNIHAFVLPEVRGSWGADIPAGLTQASGMMYDVLDHKNFALVAGQITAFRAWMQQHGQQNKPLFVSEYGVLFPDWVATGNFTPEQIRDSYMYPSFSFFMNQTDANLGYPADGYRLVQRWSWYSLDDDGFNGNLFYPGLNVAQGGHPQGITPLGTFWDKYVQSLGPSAGKPYAPQPSEGRVNPLQSGHVNLNRQPDSADCAGKDQVHLLIYERSSARTGVFSDGLGSPPRLERESVICLP